MIDVINRAGNLSKGVDHDASFYGVQMCGWMLMDSQSASICKKQRRDISAAALFHKKKSFLCVRLLLDDLCVSFSDCIKGCLGCLRTGDSGAQLILGCLRTGDCGAQLGVVVMFI